MTDSFALTYRVKPTRPETHLFDVELSIPIASAEPLVLQMPAWIPGSYMIRDFARHVVSMRARGIHGPLEIDKLDKHSWRVATDGGAVSVIYQVYAGELSVRAAHLDRTHGYFNGACLLLRVVGWDRVPCRLELLPPEEPRVGWRVATSLRRLDAPAWGFGGYGAEDYADLIDHPVEMGEFDVLGFEVRGVPHWMAISGRRQVDAARLKRDLAMICAWHADLFGILPIDRYLFLVQTAGSGHGGLEHRHSTSLLCARADLPSPPGVGENAAEIDDGYRRFLALCSHEYFHLWHVKRIRPAVLIDASLEREAHTRLLWAFEGITSYYDELALVRAGCIDARGYLELLAATISRVLRTPGRFRQTLAEASFDAWTKFYQQDANAPNAIVSYYTKGALVALALDLRIRRDTRGRHSLDDVMRALWDQFGRTGSGVPERGVEAVARAVTGLDLDAFFVQALDGTEDIDLEPLLASVGVMMRLRPASGARDVGAVVERFGPIATKPGLGLRLDPDASEPRIATVLADSPAEQAGLAAGDTLIAIDGLRVTPANIETVIGRMPIGVTLNLHAFRRDELLCLAIQAQPAPADTCDLCLMADPPASAARRRAEWLGASASAEPGGA